MSNSIINNCISSNISFYEVKVLLNKFNQSKHKCQNFKILINQPAVLL